VSGATAVERVRKYFEAIPSQPDPPAVDVTEPPQTAERRRTLEDPLARVARVDVAYHIPSSLSPDDDTIDLLAEILATGRSSRLFEVLVRQKQLALAVGAFAENSRGPRLFRIVATVSPGKTPDDVEAGIYAEIERLKAGPVADWEIEKSRNGARRQFVGSLNSSLSRAAMLAEATRLYGDPGELNTVYDRAAKLNASDVLRVAKQYLTPENRVVVVTTPKPAAKEGQR
jgi:predicted Zn-dependent peptidase